MLIFYASYGKAIGFIISGTRNSTVEISKIPVKSSITICFC